MCTRLSLSVPLLLLWVSLAHAQLVVIDPADIAQNTITAIESTLTTIEAILIEAQGVLNLTPLEGISTAQGIVEDMRLLGQLVEQAQGLSYDVASLEGQITVLFNLDTAPDTRDGLAERLAQIKQVKYECYSYAAKVQTLLRTAIRTVDHLQGLLETLSALVGNLTGHQTHTQATIVAAKHLANLDVQNAAFHRAQTVDKLGDLVIIESITKIQARRIEDWPGF
jgi:conjugal transfer/entry exclusion protein